MGADNAIFYLVRHGEAEQNARHILSSTDNAENFGLTELGKSQVLETAGNLAEEKIDVIFSSPLRRARETAEIVSAATGAVVTYDDRLRETDFGIWSGQETSEFWKKYPNPLSRIDGDENDRLEGFRAMRDRLSSFLSDIPGEYTGKRIVIVSHGDPIEILRGVLLEISLEESVATWSPKLGSWTKINSPRV